MYLSLLFLDYLSAKDIFVGLPAFSALDEMSVGLDRLLLSLLYASPNPTLGCCTATRNLSSWTGGTALTHGRN
jgi:hypothetical protein